MRMKLIKYILVWLLLLCAQQQTFGHNGTAMRRPISPAQPAWIIHIDVWNNADPQKIIDLIPADIRPYAIFNISTSSEDSRSADGPAIYDSWMKVCAQNRVWAMIQCASGAYNRMPDDDIKAYKRYFENYPNFLGFNFAEQFWGYGENGNATFEQRLQLFANLLPVCHEYGGYLAISFCDSYYNADKMPVAYMRRNAQLCDFLSSDPDHFLCFEKFTLKKNFYEIESQCLGAWLGGYAGQYGIRYDQCGWLTKDDVTDETKGSSDFVTASGAIPIAEHVMLTGQTIIDGPELIREQCTYEAGESLIDNGYTRRNWALFPQFQNISIDLFRKILDGTIRIMSREEVIDRTKICILNDVTDYKTPETLYDGLYRSDSDQGGSRNHWLDNRWWMKTTGRYPAIPFVYDLIDSKAQALAIINQSDYNSRWPSVEAKQAELNSLFTEEYEGDLYAGRQDNGWVTYNPYQYDESVSDGYRICGRSAKRAQGVIPLQYNTCDKILLDYAPYSLGIIREYTDKVTVYLTNYQVSQSGNNVTESEQIEDAITIEGANSQPTLSWTDRGNHSVSSVSSEWASGKLVIKVRHNGPLDLTISCKGNAVNRKTSAQTAQIEMPELPAIYDGTLQYEAEHADYKNIGICRANAFKDGFRGHYGQGFVEMGESRNAMLRDTITIPVASQYDLSVRYKTSKSGSVRVKSNDEDVLYALSATGDDWEEAVNTITLQEGENVVYIQNVQNVNVMIDCIRITRRSQATSIKAVPELQGTEAAFYDLRGQQTVVPGRGVYIVKDNNGKARKVIK